MHHGELFDIEPHRVQSLDALADAPPLAAPVQSVASAASSVCEVREPPTPGASKDTWRRWLRDRQTQVDPGTAATLVASLHRFIESVDVTWNDRVGGAPSLGNGLILFYRAMPQELSLDGLADALGWQRFAVTRTPLNGPLTLHPAIGAMEQHRFGFPQPIADAFELQPHHITLALVPGMAFDRDGTRLGHGAGYFDELLARLPADRPRIGIARRELIFDRLPAEAHDVPMTHLATEDGVVAVEPNGGQ